MSSFVNEKLRKEFFSLVGHLTSLLHKPGRNFSKKENHHLATTKKASSFILFGNEELSMSQEGKYL